MPDSLRATFAALLVRYGNLAELARKGGVSVRSLTYKRDGDRRVTQWDVWAMKSALRERNEPSPDEASSPPPPVGTPGTTHL